MGVMGMHCHRAHAVRSHELNCTRFARRAEHGEVPLVKRGVLLPPNTATHIMECCGKRFQ